MKNYLKIHGVLCVFIVLTQILSINVGISIAAERYKGILVVWKDGKYKIADKDYVELVLDKDTVKSMRLHTKAAHKDVKYSDCRKLENDGSNFTKWFSIVCRSIKSYDGKSAAWLEYYFVDSYAGISPEITPQYSMYEKLKEVADALGLPVPSRTFVIYADKKPIFEFFLYPEKIKKAALIPYVMDNGYFSCDIPPDWRLTRGTSYEEEDGIYGMELAAPGSGKFPTLIFVTYYAPDNTDFKDKDQFLAVNSRNVLGETKSPTETYGPIIKTTVGKAQSAAFSIAKERKRFLHLESRSEESVVLREMLYVVPSARGGFHVLHFLAPKADYERYLPVFDRLVASFKGV